MYASARVQRDCPLSVEREMLGGGNIRQRICALTGQGLERYLWFNVCFCGI